VRSATAVRLGLGSLCLAGPRLALGIVGGPDRGDARTQLLARVIGGRLLLQAAGDLALGRRSRRIDVLVDVVHAASMLPVVVARPRHRRTALASAAIATGLAVLEAAGGRTR
jgi:hypothetical protein